MKKILLIVLSVLLFVPFTIKAEEKLKIYLFEAGDCPYCEAQKEYFRTIKGYGETFEVITKQLYIDHIDWEPGKDYDLGVKVASEFNALGFDDASYEATPFVVISDIYAAAGYNNNLEDIVNYAIGEGDKDAVACIENGGENCIRETVSAFDTSSSETKEDVKYGTGSIVSSVVVILVIVFIIIYTTKKRK